MTGLSIEYVFNTIGYSTDDLSLDTYESSFDDDKPVAVADWNKIASDINRGGYLDAERPWLYFLSNNKGWEVSNRVERIISNMGYECRYQDEGYRCDDCYKFVPAHAGYHGDMETAVIVGDCSVMCPNCVRESPDDYIKGLTNNPDGAQKLLSDDALIEMGWVKLNEDSYESGFHPGQTDDGHNVTERLRKNGEKRDLLFSIDGAGQFDVSFSVWAKEAE